MAIIIGVGAIVLVLGAMFGPARMQQRGMDEATTLQAALDPILAADPRFSRVSLRVMTHPSLVADGEVADTKTLDDLRKIIVAPQGAHFRVMIHVKIDAEPTTQK